MFPSTHPTVRISLKGLTWVLFQQFKELQLRTFKRPPKDYENSLMGCLSSAATVSIMIPMDTIKTHLVTQVNYPDSIPYKGIADAVVRITREEGAMAFYRGLPPRLVSVVPMIGIQFGIYEYMKKYMLAKNPEGSPFQRGARRVEDSVGDGPSSKQIMESVAMEAAADSDQPFPAHLQGGGGDSGDGSEDRR